MKYFLRLRIFCVLIGCGITAAIAADDVLTDHEKQTKANEFLEHMQGITLEQIAANETAGLFLTLF